MEELISQAVSFLKDGKVILSPTDTIWGLACDATSEKAIARIQEIKKRDISKNFILLVSSLRMLEKYVKVPQEIIALLEAEKYPTSVIYQEVYTTELPLAKDHSIAFRIVQDDFCKALINAFGRPIVSTSANISGEPSPENFSQITQHIKDLVDFIVPYNQENQESKTPSRLIKMEKGEIIFIRK